MRVRRTGDRIPLRPPLRDAVRVPYDPDGDPADFDDTDIDALQEWADHPNTAALIEDLGREMRSRPPAEQIATLAQQLPAAVRRRDEVAGLIAASDSPDADPRLPLLHVYEQQVQAFADRISELLTHLND